MSQHEKLSERTGVKVYFADSHAPWQWGVNENTNGLLRQYVPEGIGISVFSQVERNVLSLRRDPQFGRTAAKKSSASVQLPVNGVYLLSMCHRIDSRVGV